MARRCDNLAAATGRGWSLGDAAALRLPARTISNLLFHSALAAPEGDLLAKPNYQFEKRQRDLAKKRKQEEKRLQKLADKAAAGGGGDVAADPSAAAPPDADAAAVAPRNDEAAPQL